MNKAVEQKILAEKDFVLTNAYDTHDANIARLKELIEIAEECRRRFEKAKADIDALFKP